MGWLDTELVLVALAAMLSPTTLTFCVLALVLGDRPLRTGAWFYAGAMGATLAIGVVAAFVLGDAAASSSPSTPKTWVAVVDVVAAGLLLAWVARAMRRPPDLRRTAGMIERMGAVASSPAIAIVGAGAALANPGGFIPIALKTISERDPSAAEYVAAWVFFAVVALLPLAVALVSLGVAPDVARRTLQSARGWLERRARTIAAVILVALAAVLLRNGITGLTG
jgi:Sap, sulfolipid-1-addressing protein